MPSCYIKTCFNRTGIEGNNANGVFFYQFPSPHRSPERFSKWIKFAGTPFNHYNFKNYDRLCSYHFEPKDMDDSQLLRQKLLREIGEKISGPSLKPGAVPSLMTTDLPDKCFVNGCSEKCEKYSFPNRLHSPERFKSWVSFCNRKLLPGVKSGICKHHFKQEDFEEGTEVLKKGTVPTRTDSLYRASRKKANKSKSTKSNTVKTNDKSLRQTRVSRVKQTNTIKETSKKIVDITLISKSIVNSDTCIKSIRKSGKFTIKDGKIYLSEGNRSPSIPMSGFISLSSEENNLPAAGSKDRQNLNSPRAKYVSTSKNKKCTHIQVSKEESKKSKLVKYNVIKRIEANAEANNRISLNTADQSEISKEPERRIRIQVKPLHLLINPPVDKKEKYKENAEEVLSVRKEYMKKDLEDRDTNSKTGILETIWPVKEETCNIESSREHLTAKNQKYSETLAVQMKPIDNSDFKIETPGEMEVEEIEIKEEPIWFP